MKLFLSYRHIITLGFKAKFFFFQYRLKRIVKLLQNESGIFVFAGLGRLQGLVPVEEVELAFDVGEENVGE